MQLFETKDSVVIVTLREHVSPSHRTQFINGRKANFNLFASSY